MNKIKNKETYKLKKGDETHLDMIYDVQSLCDGTWWDHIDGELDDYVIITRDIHFEIIEYK